RVTGRACGYRQLAQRRNETLPLDPIEGDVEYPGDARSPSAIEVDPAKRGEPFPEALAQSSQSLLVHSQLQARQLTGGSEPHHLVCRQCSGAQPLFLATAKDQRLQQGTRRAAGVE